MTNQDAPTITANGFRDYQKIVSNSIRKQNIVLLQSSHGNIFSVHGNINKQDEHQAQRPPTANVVPYSGSRIRNISYHYKYGVPEPTFESVSPPDLQIEKVDRRYLNASDATILH